MRSIRAEENAMTVFADNVLEESFVTDPLSDLQKILKEVEELNQKYNTKDEQKLYKFIDIKNCVKTIDISFNDSGELNLDNLRTEINNSGNEYIKIRVPSDVDLRDIDLNVDGSDDNKIDNNNNNNDEQKKKTRDREKTIAEYFV